MKKITLSLCALAISLASVAQNYYHIEFTSDVTKDYLFGDFGALGKEVMTKPSSGALNDQYSSKQTIPFNFKFYGQDVNEYLISDNGYITFNTSASTSTGAAMALPAGGEPNNAIYAFWSDFELKSAPNPNFRVNVTTYTKGQAPNRTHVIQWFGISVKGKVIAANADVYAFALVLHEKDGTFDVVNSSYGSSATKGTMGAENNDGSKGYAVANSPNISFPVATSTNPADLAVYRFYYNVQEKNDAGVVVADIPRMIKEGNNMTVKAKVVNFGSEALTSFDLNYSVNGGTVETKSFNGLNIPAGGSYEAQHDVLWNSSSAGTDYQFNIYTSNVNGSGSDDKTSNDSLKVNVLVNTGATTQRIVLAEESTGAWCGFCPDGHVTAQLVEDTYADIIFVKHHSGDGMAKAENSAFTAVFADGYPDLVVDRTLNGSARSQWAALAASRRTVGAPATVEITNKNFNESTREISYDINVTFVDDYAGDLRIGSILLEDNVRGPANNQWSQVNYYSKFYQNSVNNPSHPMYNETYPMVGYYHNHVVSAMPNGTWGEAGVIPEVAKKGEKYTLNVKYSLPAMTVLPPYGVENNTEFCSTITEGQYQYGMNKAADMAIVGFVASHDEFVSRNRPILNSKKEYLWNVATGISSKEFSASVKIYPNPAQDVVNISVEDGADVVIVKILDLNGKVVSVNEISNGQGSISTDNLTNGMYLMDITSGQTSTVEKLVINKN